MQDPIADMLTRIRNSLAVQKQRVTMPASKLKVAIAKVLVNEGYLQGHKLEASSGKPSLSLDLKYYDGKPVIERLERVSKPSIRNYKPMKELPSVNGGLGVAIISTPRGVMPDKQARKLGVGGEVLAYVS